MTAPERGELVQTFRFTVTLTSASAASDDRVQLGTGAFSECSGLELEADVLEYLEGGRNDTVVRRVGRVKLVPLVLKRGMLLPVAPPDAGETPRTGAPAADTALWDWLTGMVAGRLPIPRYDGLVQVWSPDGRREVACWTFWRGLPSRVAGPTLNAKTGEVAVEELHIVHEGLLFGNLS
jgi:phage tail-like protein